MSGEVENKKFVFYSKISKQSDRLLILIPKPIRPIFQKFHGKAVKVTVEIIE